MKTTGRVNGIISNIVIVKADGPVAQNEICYVWTGDTKMMAEVIKVIGDDAYVQVYDSTRGLKIGDRVEFEGHMLEATLAPGLLSRNYDGLQNDLEKMDSLFIERGSITDPIDFDKTWEFTPLAKAGDKVSAASWLGEVKEQWIPHKIMVPFTMTGSYTVKSVAAAGSYKVTDTVAVLTDAGAQIAAGDYARRTDLHTGDEIEALSRSFDKMADAVQEKIADLEADVQRREDFVGAFTHELKTPMTSIIGYADMLHTMQTDPDEQREAAAAIVHEGRRLEALSRKLLALLGLNEEGVELTAVPLPALWPRLHAACPDVTLRTPAAAPTVRGDADLLLDLLCNLVQNAAKASAPGAPVLVLCAQAGDAVTLTVADRGCGIPPELIPRVTEPFYMVDKSRARRQGGSGLGLALCQRIAAAHGSALRIESEPDRGTRVSVTLPVWKEDAP